MNQIQNINEEIRIQFQHLAEAAKSLDFDRYLKFLDKESFTSLNADGTVFCSFEEFAEAYRPQFLAVKKYHSLDFDKVHINVINEKTVVLVNQFIADLELNSGERIQAAGAGTQIWSREKGEWKLIHVSSSSKS